MSRYNLSYMMEEYTDDFGNKYPNIPVKIQGNAPSLADFYKARSKATCGGSLLFKKRHLLATFANGRKLEYPCKTFEDVSTMVTNLMGKTGDDKALCIDFVGEKWSFVPASYLKATLAFKDGPYTNLPPRKTYKTYSFKYDADVDFTGNTEIQLSARIPTDNETLHTCQKKGLGTATEGAAICTAAALLTARHFIIQASATDSFNSEGFKDNKVIRKAYVAKPGDLKTTATEIAKCGQCLGYQGESIPNIHLLMGGE